MSDAAPIELAGMFLEWQRIEDAKAELAEQSKDLFKVAKDKGYDTKAMRAVFREKRIELEASPEDAAKAEEAEAMNDLYRSALDRGLTARARPAHDAREIIEEFPLTIQSYSEAKGRGFVAKLTDEQMAAALAYDGEDSPVGELTDNQESETASRVGGASGTQGKTEPFTIEASPSSDESEQDDVGATASSTNSEHTISPAPERKAAGSAPREMGGEGANTGGEDVDRSASARPSGQVVGAQPAGVDAGIEPGFVERNTSGPDAKRATNPHSPAAIPLGAANSAGEAPSSSRVSPATDTDDDGDDDVPAFIKQNKPDCLKLKDGHCRLSFATSALCAECNQRRAMARALV